MLFLWYRLKEKLLWKHWLEKPISNDYRSNLYRLANVQKKENEKGALHICLCQLVRMPRMAKCLLHADEAPYWHGWWTLGSTSGTIRSSKGICTESTSSREVDLDRCHSSSTNSCTHTSCTLSNKGLTKGKNSWQQVLRGYVASYYDQGYSSMISKIKSFWLNNDYLIFKTNS